MREIRPLISLDIIDCEHYQLLKEAGSSPTFSIKTPILGLQ